MHHGSLAVFGVACAIALFVTHGVVVVTGESMKPALARGDLLVYRRTADVSVGEVAVYSRTGGELVVHRVVALGERGTLRTKGDANEAADPVPVSPEYVRGRIVVRVPSGVVTGG